MKLRCLISIGPRREVQCVFGEWQLGAEFLNEACPTRRGLQVGVYTYVCLEGLMDLGANVNICHGVCVWFIKKTVELGNQM